MKDIIDKASEVFGINRCDLASKWRKREAARARFAAMLVLREKHRLSFPEIGRIMERHHTTVMHGIEQAKILREDDLRFAAAVRSIELGKYVVDAHRD